MNRNAPTVSPVAGPAICPVPHEGTSSVLGSSPSAIAARPVIGVAAGAATVGVAVGVGVATIVVAGVEVVVDDVGFVAALLLLQAVHASSVIADIAEYFTDPIPV